MNYGKKAKTNFPIIILHGWGLRGSIYDTLKNLLAKEGYRVFAPDLPGFGSEPLEKPRMKLEDYVHFVHHFIKKHKLSNVILIGHSFGGRIGTLYAIRFPGDLYKLVLTGTPVIRHRPIKKQIAFLAAVVGGKVLRVLPNVMQDLLRKILYKSIGEWNYYNAGPLKQVFKNIINEDLIPYAKEIRKPVVLIWGRQDRLVPASDVEEIKKYIPQVTSVIIENEGHRLPCSNPEAFYNAFKKLV